VLDGLSPPRRAPLCGVRSSGESRSAAGSTPGRRRGEDRTGEWLEPLLMPREAEPRMVGCRGGVKGLAAEKRRVPVGEATRPGRAPLSPGYRGHPPRSQLVRAERGNPRRGPALAGKPTVRKAQFPGGNRMTEKRMPAAERQQETKTRWAGPSGWSSRITGRIRDLVPGPERVLTRSGEPRKRR
jgi:hypothetical protein